MTSTLKGDGRYVISNGKDQSMKLWDLRKMRGHTDFETYEHKHYGLSSYDYRLVVYCLLARGQSKLTLARHGYYGKPRHAAHPKDCSVMTYRGHQVFRTLIRCHFSPTETTGGNYLYTGSSDGRIHVRRFDFSTSAPMTRH